MTGMRNLALASLAATALACGGNEVPPPQAVQTRVALESFENCRDLEKYIEDTAVLDMRTQLEQSKKGLSYWGWGRGVGGPEMAMDGAAASSAPSKSGPSAHTTTNTQVSGVDEADFVKNDGTRIFVLSGGTLYINQSWPADQLRNVSKIQIDGWPQEMFLDDKNHVVVFSSVWSPYAFDGRFGDVICLSLDCGYSSANTTKVTVIDVADLSAPKVQQEYFLPGSYSNSRRIGSSVRVVLSDSFRWPADIRWWPEYSDGLYQDTSRLGAAFDELIAINEKRIRAASLEDWLPQSKRRLEDGSEIEITYDCRDFHKSNAPTRLGLVTVATLNLDSPGNMTRTAVVGEAGEVYSSANNLYIANRHWWWWPEPGQRDHTYLHKFDITNPDEAIYVASGGVNGHIVDQFSMDENSAGYFRVATTIATRVEDANNWWGRMETTNRVSVLGEKNGTLVVVGESEELAKGERIFSSRFVEEKGFVVTFRQVDPLFTFDLSDPANPRRVGELKVEGFSSYIHPLDDDHLLTIGTYIDEANNWGTRALQLSIFDVSDMARPSLKHRQLVGSASGWSEAQYEHKAFNYFPARKLLAIPFWDYNPTSRFDYWYDFVSDLRVFAVDAAAGFTLKGAVSMKDVYSTYGDSYWTYYWSPWVRRSVMADQYVYAISDAGIRVADVANLSSPLATVRFEKAVSGNTGTGGK